MARRAPGERHSPVADPATGAQAMVDEAMIDTESLSDEMLLAGFGAGDPLAALAFVRRFQNTVFGVALGVIGDVGLAEDIAQQGFERAWRQAETYDPRRGTIRSWLTGIVHHLAVDTARAMRAYPTTDEDLDELIAAMTETPETPERCALARESVAELGRALAALPAEQARAVVLTGVHGFTARELAAREDIPLGTAKSRIRAALAKLHETALTSAGRDE